MSGLFLGPFGHTLGAVMENHWLKKLSNIILAIFRRCCDVMYYLTEILLFFVMAIITLEVFSRYVLKSPTLWVVDVSRYSLVYITFLGATTLLLRGEHINVDLLITHVSERNRLILYIIGNVISALAFLTFFLFSTATTWDHYQRGLRVVDPIEIPKFIPLAIIPIGAFFLFVGSIIRMLEYLGEWKNPRKKEVS